MKIEGKKILLVVPQKQFRKEEVFGPMKLFEVEGARVTTASTELRTCRSITEESIDPDIMISDLNAEDYDAVVLASGTSVPGTFWKDETLITLVSTMAQAGKVVAAISLSTVVLAKAHLLEKQPATVYSLPEGIEALEEEGAIYTSERLVVRDNLIMAEGPTDAEAFAVAVVGALS